MSATFVPKGLESSGLFVQRGDRSGTWGVWAMPGAITDVRSPDASALRAALRDLRAYVIFDEATDVCGDAVAEARARVVAYAPRAILNDLRTPKLLSGGMANVRQATRAAYEYAERFASPNPG